MTENRACSTRKGSNPYITIDGSGIRELMHPEVHKTNNQMFAEATIFLRRGTRLHKHHTSSCIMCCPGEGG